MLRIAGLVGLTLLLMPPVGAEFAVTDATGGITALNLGGDSLALQTSLRIPLKGWGRMPGFTDARNTKYTVSEGKRTWTGIIPVTPEASYRFEQTIEEFPGVVTTNLKITAEGKADIEGVYYWLDVPISVFAGGPCSLLNSRQRVANVEFPREQPAARHFARGDANGILMDDAAGKTSVRIVLDRAIPVTVQDTREWKGSVYSMFCQLAPSLAPGESTSLRISISASAQPDTTAAQLTLDASKPRYRLDGFGGNYCFGIESPVTQYTLKNLKVAWARTELTASEWEPVNDNASPTDNNWAYYEAQDRDGSNLRREFLLARQIQDLGIPYVISIWRMPKWFYPDPTKASGKLHITPELWPELVELIGTYLTYAKNKYGVEPDLFCFNEANIGVDVLLTAEEHRDALKLLGAHFDKLGLKTRMILADATGPRGTHTYALPAAADPEAMQYVGAVAFHSWGGGSAADYSAWGDLAERLKLPLLVTELGVDAGAWRTRAFDSYLYALREVSMYQELLLYARPQGTMQWEFTSDYSIVKETKNEKGEVTIQPTPRFWFVKHFCNLTPLKSQALTTASDNAKVLFTAFSGEVAAKPVLSLHVSNSGAERSATITGIPAGTTRLNAVRTSEQDSFRTLEPVPVVDGKAQLTLTAQSLLTLTTADLP